jgi:pimeloyl-ACP methyl ester carboxylesterase
MQNRLIETESSKIEVLLEGQGGPLVVMVPAGSRGASDFDTLSSTLAKCGWRTAAVNPRYAGKSEGPLDGLTLHDQAGDLAGVIDALGGRPAAVIGHAFGNRVARCLAADRPEMVSCLVLLAAGGKVPPPPEYLEAMKRLSTEGITDEERKAVFKAAFFASDSDPSFWMTGWWPKARRMQASKPTPIEDWWSGGDAPIMVIQGQEDICALPANGRALKEEFGDRITLIEIPNAAHALLSEQPALIADKVIAYLKDHHPIG